MVVRRKPDVPAQRAAWREIAHLLGGEVEEGKRPTADKVLVLHGPWTITLDCYIQSNGSAAVWYTRVRAYVTGWRGLTLTVRRRNVFDRLWEAMGFGNRLPLSPQLLSRYVVKGKPASRVPSLFAGADLTGAIGSVPSLRLQVKRPSRKSRRRYGEDAGVVVCRTTGIIHDVTRLAGMIRVVAETLVALERVGEARWETPSVHGSVRSTPRLPR